MKRIVSLIIAGMIGGAVVLTGMLFFNQQAVPVEVSRTPLHQVNLQNSSVELPDNFTVAAQVAMPAVVHINASESVSLAQDRSRSRRDPFSFFFGDEGFFNGPRAKSGKGSGVIISDDGFIVTNNHVIDFADEFEVTLHDNRKFKATLIGSDPRTDLAVIKVDADDLPYLKFGDSEDIRVGEWVLAVGNPFDLTSTVTAGIVSAKGRDNIIRRNDAIEDFIQTDAVVNPGNSGGALVNVEGELIGINTAIATATGYYAGYSFAIPTNMLRPIIENLIEFGGPRPRLGVSIASIPAYEEYAEIDMDIDRGAVITRIEDGGAAQYAGLLPNDVVIAVNNQSVSSPDDLIKFLSERKIGDEVTITIYRNGNEKDIAVKLKAE